MNEPEQQIPPENDPPENPPKNEAELLDRESQLARTGLERLRGEVLQSLARSANLKAWAERYPWPTLGAAAVAGVGAGWALGSTLRRKPPADDTPPTRAADAPSAPADGAANPHPSSRLVGGLGTMVGALASAAMGTATQALTQVIKDTIHDSMHPDVSPEDLADGGSDDLDADQAPP